MAVAVDGRDCGKRSDQPKWKRDMPRPEDVVGVESKSCESRGERGGGRRAASSARPPAKQAGTALSLPLSATLCHSATGRPLPLPLRISHTFSFTLHFALPLPAELACASPCPLRPPANNPTLPSATPNQNHPNSRIPSRTQVMRNLGASTITALSTAARVVASSSAAIS